MALRVGVRLLAVLLGTLAIPGVVVAATIAAGAEHTVVVTPDGHVWAWGLNTSGQVGDGTGVNRTVPTEVPGLTDVIAVSSSMHHTLALKSDGTVWSWGYNGYGGIGDGSYNNRLSPYQLPLTNIVAVAAGNGHSVALQSNGTVWAWGRNGVGQLGDGTNTQRTTPQSVAAWGTVAAVATGSEQTLALRTDGTVWAAGGNWSGELGDGTQTHRATPVQMVGLSNVASISGGGGFSLIALTDGTVRGYGDNTEGKLGDGTTNWPNTTIVTATGLSGVTAIATGWYHSLARKSDGSVWAWGDDASYRLGDGTPAARQLVPTQTLLASIALIAAGIEHNVAVSTDGTVWTWGSNGNGRLGDGTTTTPTVPIAISGPNYAWKIATPTFDVAAGTYSTEQTVTVSCVTPGVDIHYTLNGSDPTIGDPVVTSGSTVTVDRSATLKARAWRTGFSPSNIASAAYTLTVSAVTMTPGSGTYTSATNVTLASATPSAVIHFTTDGSTPTDLSATYSGPMSIGTSTVLKAIAVRDGWTSTAVAASTYTMNFGTLAAPTFSPAAGTFTSSVTVTLSAATAGATIRYTTDGSDPNATSFIYTTPILLEATTTIKARAFHPDYTMSAASTGAYTIQVATPTLTPIAGTYAAGQLITVTCATPSADIHYTIDGVEPTQSDPTIASGGQLVLGAFTLKARAWKAGATTSAIASATYTVTGDVTTGSLSAGYAHSVALRNDGTVWAWGNNDSVQLGNGTSTWTAVPGLVAGLTGVAQVATGGAHSLARMSDGTVRAWGENVDGRLGDGTINNQRSRPVSVLNLSTAVAVAASSQHSLALKSDGTLVAWGVQRQRPAG